MVRRPDSVVEAEFRALEREVRQRECSHDGRRHRIHEIAAHGVATWWVCGLCGKRWDARPTMEVPASYREAMIDAGERMQRALAYPRTSGGSGG